MNHFWDPDMLADIITKFAIYYKETLHEDQIEMYVNDLSRLSPEQLDRAMRLYRSNPRNDRFPLPAVLIALITQEQEGQDSNEIGAMVAGRIMQAKQKFGNYRYQEAKEFIGELGWMVVKQSGGWSQLCNDGNRSTTIAQLRNLATALHKAAKLGKHDAPIALPSPEPKVSLGELMKNAQKALEKK